VVGFGARGEKFFGGKRLFNRADFIFTSRMKNPLRLHRSIVHLALFFGLSGASQPVAFAADLGIFSTQADIGEVAKPGAVQFNSKSGEYTITGGGGNIWGTNDAFHFVWKQMSGDFTLTANVRFNGTNGNPHRKACLLVRQSLAPGSTYADVAVHGEGLTSIQYRSGENDLTHEIRSVVSAPTRVRLEKRGDYFSIWVAAPGEALKLDGGYLRVPTKGNVYVGLGVCAHDNQAISQAVFSNVELTPVASTAKPVLESTLETVNVPSSIRTAVYHTRDHIEAPNWSRDGKLFYFNSGGRIYTLPVAGGTPQMLDTGLAVNCNNDHGISPDGTQLAISDGSQGDKQSRVYLLPIQGGTPRLITPLGPSYWHGWSADGKTLAYCAQRNGEFDIYTMPTAGGEETRLTTATGLDDGPDYSPHGQFIYFNSERSGLMQIWRMKADGSDQQQITSDQYNNWFAHPSPDGTMIVFLSYDKSVKGHPANQDVTLRLMTLADKKIRALATLFGGQGTMNVPSWSPDGSQLAFVSYQLVWP
jgi:regulation of enolase protein 1 (concanavalin A-like superfamily)